MSALKYWLWLSDAAKLGVRAKEELLKYYGSPENMFAAPKGEFERLIGRKLEGLEELEKRDLSAALRILDKCDEQGIRIISVQDAAYPGRLRNIYAPPSLLYVKGTMPAVDDEVTIALIGTRNCTPYGIKMTDKLAAEIAECGGIVVSGLTMGIEIAGAEAALRAGGRVIGVLGTSHEGNKNRLAYDVAASGVLISEYPPGSESYRSNFRARNRISAGLSLGVAVVEAPEKSNTKLFVAEAAEQGKEIFAVPGNADAYNCQGSNAMIKEGAVAVTDGWEIVREFAQLYPDKVHKPDKKAAPAIKQPPQEKTEDEPENRPEDESKIKSKDKTKSAAPTKKEIDKSRGAEYIDLRKLSESQQKIVSVMDKSAQHVDEIISRSGYSPAKVLADLTLMQLQGYVTQDSGKRFTLNIKAK